MPPGARTWVACVRLEPYALRLLEGRQPGVPVAVLEGRKVAHANDLARLQGVTPGLPLVAALSRCPELHAEEVSAPTVQTEWARLLEGLYGGYSPRVHGPQPGTVWLSLTPEAARELAVSLHAPLGLARTQELALLAAQRATVGEVKAVLPGAEEVFLALTPLGHLLPLGLSKQNLQHLHFLGLRDVRDLGKWGAGQRAALLGKESRIVADLLAGKGNASVPLYQPREVIELRLSFDAPLEEPGQLEAALADLLPEWPTAFRGRVCSYLSVRAETVGGTLSGTRRLKWPLELKGLRRVACLALVDSGALTLGVDALTVRFSGFAQPSRQIGLWPDVRELDAVRGVLDRFPHALVRVGWRDVFAPVVDAQFVWTDFQTNEERPHRNAPQVPLAPPRRAPITARAFFEAPS